MTQATQTSVRMCATCAGAFQYTPTDYDETPDTHSDIGEQCPTVYRE